MGGGEYGIHYSAGGGLGKFMTQAPAVGDVNSSKYFYSLLIFGMLITINLLILLYIYFKRKTGSEAPA